MKTRSDELREQSRRVLGWSLGIAALIHVAVFYFVSWSGTEGESGSGLTLLATAQWTGAPVDVFFGPPKIFEPDGTLSTEAPDRVLEAARAIRLPPACSASALEVGTPGSGSVRLSVNGRGRVDSVALNESTGNACWDGVATQVAADLWYRWLPSDRFPAPVELLQPITVAWSAN
jgi:hypothetical protein